MTRVFATTMVLLLVCAPAFAGTAIFSCDCDADKIDDTVATQVVTYDGTDDTITFVTDEGAALGGDGFFLGAVGETGIAYGDFTYTLDFHGADTVPATAASGHGIALMFSGGGTIYLAHFNRGGGVGAIRGRKIGPPDAGFVAGFSNQLTVEGLRIALSGNAVTLSYHDGSSWNVYFTIPDVTTYAGIDSGDTIGLGVVLFNTAAAEEVVVDSLLVTGGSNVPDVNFIDDDCDGLSNTDEGIYGTDPNNPDSDGDTFEDGVEVAAGTNPMDINDFPTFAPSTSPTGLVIAVVVLALAGCAIMLRRKVSHARA